MSRPLHLPRLVLGSIAALLMALLAPALDDDQVRGVRHTRGGPQRLESADAAGHGVEELAPTVAPQADLLGSLPISAPAIAGSATDGEDLTQPAQIVEGPKAPAVGASVRVETVVPSSPSLAAPYRLVPVRGPPAV